MSQPGTVRFYIILFFKKTNFAVSKIHLFSILNTKQINDGSFSNKAGENFNLVKIFLNERFRL